MSEREKTHYERAEELLKQADRDVSSNWESMTGERKADVLAAAQVHATLAMVEAMRPQRYEAKTAAPSSPDAVS